MPRKGSRSTVASSKEIKPSVFDRLTNTAAYTGIHKQRFDDSGIGRGVAGRDNLILYDGSTESAKRCHEVYSSVLPDRVRKPLVLNLGKYKFGTQSSTAKLIWLFRCILIYIFIFLYIYAYM
eukprot:GHVR01171350.1.p1 GENE.GHVR01171350.1~~GHVR01171350.1.p1  ORF type:complete len:122 (-),score=15.93 GHVR01171350.1:42-407(-)